MKIKKKCISKIPKLEYKLLFLACQMCHRNVDLALQKHTLLRTKYTLQQHLLGSRI